MVEYPERLPITPLTHPPSCGCRVPGSKSITNRALVLAALCSGSHRPHLAGCLRSEDTEVMVGGLRTLGFDVKTAWDLAEINVSRPGAALVPATSADLFVANSGTTMRFLTALAALGNGKYRLDGIPRMRERPIRDLLDALNALGVEARSEMGNGCPPVIVETSGLKGGIVRVKGDVSSQFLSALMMVAPFAQSDVTLEVDGPLVSRPYVDMTKRMMHDWRLRIAEPTPNVFHIPGRQSGPGECAYFVEPDASAASYFFAAAAITGGRVTVFGLSMHSLQGDVCFVDVLERMGCTVERSDNALTVIGDKLRGIDVGMSDISDTVMTLAAVALFAEGPTTIRNVAHIRHKETDRIGALATELRRLGATVEEFADGLTITPNGLHGAEVMTYNDHRMAMSLALVGLRVPGVVIYNPGCVAKTYPEFFTDLERLRRENPS
jgi:3-phosphoshikimate 1-carboxyvinyltransferase